MISPILAGSITALAYAVSTLGSARSSRLAGAIPAVAGVMLVGSLLLLPVALLISPIPSSPAIPPMSFVWAVVAGVANVCGLLLAYAAYRLGAIAIVSTIGSTEGAIAAVISVATGQLLAPGAGPALVLVAVGVVLAATSGGHELEEGVAISRAQSLRAAALSFAAACCLGIGLFVAGRVSTSLPPVWVVLPGRLAGAVLVGVPLLVTGRARVPRRAVPFIALTGLAEVIGLTSFSVGARQDIATTSVLASMFAPMAAIAAFVLFRERLARRQIAGIALVVVGIALLGAVSG